MSTPVTAPTSKDINYVEAEFPEPLLKLLQEMDTGGDGSVSAKELEAFAAAVKEAKSGSFRYNHLPEAVQQAFGKWDANKDGTVDMSELVAASEATEMLKKQNKRMRYALWAVLALVLLLSLATFAMSVAAVEVTKEFRPAVEVSATEPSAGRRLLESVGLISEPQPKRERSARRRLQDQTESGEGAQDPKQAVNESKVGGLEGSDPVSGDPTNVGTVETGKTVEGEGLGAVLTQMTPGEARSLKQLSFSTASGKVDFKAGAAVRTGANEMLIPSADGSGDAVRVRNGTIILEKRSGAKEVVGGQPTEDPKMSRLDELLPIRAPGTQPKRDRAKEVPSADFREEAAPLDVGETPPYGLREFAEAFPQVGITLEEYKGLCQALKTDGYWAYTCPNGTMDEWLTFADCNGDGILAWEEQDMPGFCMNRIPDAAESLATEKNLRIDQHRRIRRLQVDAVSGKVSVTALRSKMPQLKGKVTKEAVKDQICSSPSSASRCEADPMQFDRVMQMADVNNDGMFDESEFKELLPKLSANPEQQGSDAKRDQSPTGVVRSGPLMPPGAPSVSLGGGGGSQSPEMAANKQARNEMMTNFDRNHDGVVDQNEYKSLSTDPDAEAFNGMDRAMGKEDGTVDRSEFATFMQQSVSEIGGVSDFMFCLRDMDGNGRLSMEEATGDPTVAVNEPNNRRRLSVITQHIEAHRNARRQRRLLARVFHTGRVLRADYASEVRRLSELADVKQHVLAAHSSVRAALTVARASRERRRLAASRRLAAPSPSPTSSSPSASSPAGRQPGKGEQPTQSGWQAQAKDDMTATEAKSFDSLMGKVEGLMPDIFEGAPWDETRTDNQGDGHEDMMACYEPLEDLAVLESVFYKLDSAHRDDAVVNDMLSVGVDPSMPDSPFFSCKRQMTDDPTMEPALQGGDAVDCVKKMIGADERAATERIMEIRSRKAARGQIQIQVDEQGSQGPGSVDYSQAPNPADDLVLNPDDLQEILDPMGSRRQLAACPEAREMYNNGSIGWTVVCDIQRMHLTDRRLQQQQGGKSDEAPSDLPPPPSTPEEWAVECAKTPPKNYGQKANGNYKFESPKHEKMSGDEFFQHAILDPDVAPSCDDLPFEEKDFPFVVDGTGKQRILTSEVGGYTVTGTRYANLMSDSRGPGCFVECAPVMATCVVRTGLKAGQPCVNQDDFDRHALDHCPCMAKKRKCHEEIANQFLQKVGPGAEAGTAGATGSTRLRRRVLQQQVVQHRVRQLRHRKLLAADHATQQDVRRRLRVIRRRLREEVARRLQGGSGLPDGTFPGPSAMPPPMDDATFTGLDQLKSVGTDDLPATMDLNGPEGALDRFDDDLTTSSIPAHMHQQVNWNPATDPIPDPDTRHHFEGQQPPSLAESCVPCPSMGAVMNQATKDVQANTRRLQGGNGAQPTFGSGEMRGAQLTPDQRMNFMDAVAGCVPQDAIDDIVADVTLTHEPFDVYDVLQLVEAGAVAPEVDPAQFGQKDPMDEIRRIGNRGSQGSKAGSPVGDGADTAGAPLTQGVMRNYVDACEDATMGCDPAMVADTEKALDFMHDMTPPGMEMTIDQRDMRELMAGGEAFDVLGPQGGNRISLEQFTCGQSLTKGMPVEAAREEYNLRTSNPEQGMSRSEFMRAGPVEEMNMRGSGARGPARMKEEAAARGKSKGDRMDKDMSKMTIMRIIDTVRAAAAERAALIVDPLEAEFAREDLSTAAFEMVPTKMTAGLAADGARKGDLNTGGVMKFHMALGAGLAMLAKSSGDPTGAYALNVDGTINPLYEPPSTLPDGQRNEDAPIMQGIKDAMPHLKALATGSRVLADADRWAIADALATIVEAISRDKGVPKEEAVCPDMMAEAMDDVGMSMEAMSSAPSDGSSIATSAPSTDSLPGGPHGPPDADGCVTIDSMYAPPPPMRTREQGSSEDASLGAQGNQQVRRMLKQDLGRRLQAGSLVSIDVPLTPDASGGAGGGNKQMVGVNAGVVVEQLQDHEVDFLLFNVMPWQAIGEDVTASVVNVGEEGRKAVRAKATQGVSAIQAAMARGDVNGEEGGELLEMVERTVEIAVGDCGPEERCAPGGADFAYPITDEVGNMVANYVSGPDGVLDLGIPPEFDCDSLPRSETLTMQNEQADPSSSNQWAKQPLDFGLMCRKAKERQSLKQQLSLVMDCFHTAEAVEAGRTAMTQEGAQPAGDEVFSTNMADQCLSPSRLRSGLNSRMSRPTTGTNSLTEVEKMALKNSIKKVDDEFKRRSYSDSPAQMTQPRIEQLTNKLVGAPPKMVEGLKQALASLKEQITAVDGGGVIDPRCAMPANGQKNGARDPISDLYDEDLDETCHLKECKRALEETTPTEDLVKCLIWELPEHNRDLMDDLEMVRNGEKSMRSVAEAIAPVLTMPIDAPERKNAAMKPEVKMDKKKAALARRRMRVRRRLAAATKPDCLTVNGKEYCTEVQGDTFSRELQSGDMISEESFAALEAEDTRLAAQRDVAIMRPNARRVRRRLQKSATRRALKGMHKRRAVKLHASRANKRIGGQHRR